MNWLISTAFTFWLAVAPAVMLVLAGPAAAQALPVVDEPAETTQRLTKLLEQQGAESLVDELARLFRNEKSNPVLTEQLRPFSKKVADVTAVLYDRDYGNAIRLVLVYNYYENGPIPFVYFQYTYKKVKTGWLLTNFRFKSEAAMALPDGYAAP